MFNHPIGNISGRNTPASPAYKRYLGDAKGELAKLPVRSTELTQKEVEMIMVRKESCEAIKLALTTTFYVSALLGGFPMVVTIPAAALAVYQTVNYCRFRSAHPVPWGEFKENLHERR